MDFTDQALIRRWQHGDAAAFEAIVRRWQGPVARFLARYGLGAEQTADGTQEVFLRVYRSGPSYEPRATFSTWLFQIALNIARDAARRRRPTERLEDYDAAGDDDPSASAMARESATAVQQALLALPEPLRVVVVLRHYQGMNFEEMSQVCQTPASTLKSRFAAALERLRVSLGTLRPDFEESES